MFCMKCKNDLHNCICSDLGERLFGLSNVSNFVYRMCKKCKKHYAVCKCEEPEWVMSKPKEATHDS